MANRDVVYKGIYVESLMYRSLHCEVKSYYKYTSQVINASKHNLMSYFFNNDIILTIV